MGKMNPPPSSAVRNDLPAEHAHSSGSYQDVPLSDGKMFIEYHIAENSLYHVTPEVTEIYHIPQFIQNGPQYLLDCGVVQPESAEKFLSVFQSLRNGEPHAECIAKTLDASGSVIWVSVAFSTIYDSDGKPLRAIGVLRNTVQQPDSPAQAESGLLYREALMKDALLYYEANLTTKTVITGLEQLFASLKIPYTSNYQKSLDLICQQIIHPLDRARMAAALDCEQLLSLSAAGCDKTDIEYRRLSNDGSYRWARCNVYLVSDAKSGCVESCYYVYDNHEAKLRELDLQEKAERDLLTGLYNKGTTELLIQEDLKADGVKERIGAFIIIDLDNFKLVNDHLGHAFGDAVLSEAAHKLQALCRSQDIAGRVGGDEFVIYMRNLPNQKIAESKAKEICAAFRDIYPGAFQDFQLSGSVGIALWPQDGSSFDQLYKNADAALYSAKKQGKDSYCFFSTELNSAARPDISFAAIDSQFRNNFSESIAEYVFRIMYEAKKIEPAVNAIFELLANHFSFNRCYIYEPPLFETDCNLAYEWYARGLSPIGTRKLGGMALQAFSEQLHRDDILLYSSTDNPAQSPGFPETDDVSFRFQCALTSNGQFHGFAGFDQGGSSRLPNSTDLATIRVVAQMLGFFLRTRSTETLLACTKDALREIGDDFKVCTYMIDPRTYQLTSVRSSNSNLFPNAKVGAFCYKTIRGQDTPCADCPIHQGTIENGKSCSIRWDHNGHHMKTRFVFTEQYNSHVNCLLRCYEIF